MLGSDARGQKEEAVGGGGGNVTFHEMASQTDINCCTFGLGHRTDSSKKYTSTF